MNEEIYIGFESYLANEMPADEKILFEQKLQNDVQLKEQFHLYSETTGFLATKFSSDTIDFKKNLETISTAHFAETEEKQPSDKELAKQTKVVNLKPWYFAVAASMAILFGTLLFNQSDPQYGDYSQHETAQFVVRGDNDIHLKEAQDFFNDGQFQKAVTSFEKSQQLNSPELLYFYAISLVETNQYTKATIILNDLKSGASVYNEKATWYLALSYLKQKKINECKVYLKQVPADAEDYDKAQQLLKDLD